MTTKTVAIPEDIHRLIAEAQLDIRKECGISLNLSYIVAQVLKTYTKDFAKKMIDGINTGVQNMEKIADMPQLGIAEKLRTGDDIIKNELIPSNK